MDKRINLYISFDNKGETVYCIPTQDWKLYLRSLPIILLQKIAQNAFGITAIPPSEMENCKQCTKPKYPFFSRRGSSLRKAIKTLETLIPNFTMRQVPQKDCLSSQQLKGIESPGVFGGRHIDGEVSDIRGFYFGCEIRDVGDEGCQLFVWAKRINEDLEKDFVGFQDIITKILIAVGFIDSAVPSSIRFDGSPISAQWIMSDGDVLAAYILADGMNFPYVEEPCLELNSFVVVPENQTCNQEVAIVFPFNKAVSLHQARLFGSLFEVFVGQVCGAENGLTWDLHEERALFDQYIQSREVPSVFQSSLGLFTSPAFAPASPVEQHQTNSLVLELTVALEKLFGEEHYATVIRNVEDNNGDVRVSFNESCPNVLQEIVVKTCLFHQGISTASSFSFTESELRKTIQEIDKACSQVKCTVK